MEFLNAQAKYIAEQIRSMSISQKIAIGLLLVIVVGGMWGLLRWGGQGEWSPLLDQAFTADQIQRAQAVLVGAGIETKVDKDRIMIKGDTGSRQRAQAVLAQQGALPADTTLGYEAIAADDNVFESDQKASWKQLRALEIELSRVLREFRGVEDAHVFIEVPKQRGFGSSVTASRASVNVKLRNGEGLDRQRIAAIASFVVGAVRGLEPENVRITDGMRSYRAPDATDAMPTEQLELQQKQEEHYSRKIYDQLRYIPNVLVNVHAMLRSEDQQIQERTYGKPVVNKESSESEEMSNPVAAVGPGVRPNVGRTTADAAASGATSTREKTDTTLEGSRDLKDTTIVRAKGYVERVTASVNVPHSYLARILQSQGVEKADKAAIQKIADAELPKIRDVVKPLINAADDEQLVVNWYYDMPEDVIADTQASSEAGFLALAKDYGPQAGLAMMVFFSLFMVIRIAKKAQATIAVSSPAAAAAAGGGGLGGGWSGGFGSVGGGLEPLGSGHATVGVATEMDSVMVGHEVDESLVRTQQIVNQINQMVSEDPATPAGIIDSWVKAKE